MRLDRKHSCSCVLISLPPQFCIVDAGGTWCSERLDDEDECKQGRTYEGLITNTCKEATCFSDLPMPDEWPSYITPAQVGQLRLNVDKTYHPG